MLTNNSVRRAMEGGNLEILLSAITAAGEHDLADDGLLEEAIEGAVKEFGAARD